MIIGLDVGFSATRPSSGVARLCSDGTLRLGNTTAGWEQRRRILGDEPALVAALDAPYTRAGEEGRRSCERVFTLGGFQRRCKPGLSHVPGTGRNLRRAGWESAQQLKRVAPATELAETFPRIDGCNVIEAFPNAYLGVCLPSDAYQNAATQPSEESSTGSMRHGGREASSTEPWTTSGFIWSRSCLNRVSETPSTISVRPSSAC